MKMSKKDWAAVWIGWLVYWLITGGSIYRLVAAIHAALAAYYFMSWVEELRYRKITVELVDVKSER